MTSQNAYCHTIVDLWYDHLFHNFTIKCMHTKNHLCKLLRLIWNNSKLYMKTFQPFPLKKHNAHTWKMPFECKSSCKYMVASRTMEMTPLIFQLFAFQITWNSKCWQRINLYKWSWHTILLKHLGKSQHYTLSIFAACKEVSNWNMWYMTKSLQSQKTYFKIFLINSFHVFIYQVT